MKATVRTIVIYDKTKIQPQTIDAIKNAKDGDWIPVGREEFSGFYELHLFEPEVDKVARDDAKKRPRGKG